MYRRLFGVPDVITDMTRSLEMDIKIDILDGYIRTQEVFRVISEKTGVPEGYRNPPGAKWAMMGLSGNEKRQPYMGCAPPPSPSPIRTRRGGRPPLSLSPLKESYSN